MKKWLLNNFLPMWAKKTLLMENRRLERENQTLQQKNKELDAYIQGIRTGLRASKRISIVNQGGRE